MTPWRILRTLGVASGAALAACAAQAQPATRLPVIAYLSPSPNPLQELFLQQLRRLGHLEGKTYAFEYRNAEGRFERLPALAAELVQRKPDVIVAQVTQAAIAAMKATASIPIVMIGVSDPVASGLVASLARPGGNVTGTSAVAAGVVGKQLELVRELMPATARVAVLWNPANRVFQEQQLNEATSAARELKLELRMLEARDAQEIDRALSTAARESVSALLVMGEPVFVTHAARIAELAIRYRLPSVSGARLNAEGGALLSYGPNYEDAYRGAAVYVDRILKGARPADLPVERSARFELIVNARTARALGITLPQSLLLRADRVID
jgi:putative ABC transport system substrate-binding protein